jgi:hypothetical protein
VDEDDELEVNDARGSHERRPGDVELAVGVSASQGKRGRR